MKQKHEIRIALVGDHDDRVPAHQAIPLALDRVEDETGIGIEYHWLPTPDVGDGAGLHAFDGIWCVPASPYRDMNGALTAIRHARENRVPFLGTCGGFQHALLEYARNHLGWSDAEHAETAPDSARAIITPLSCSLVEAFEPIRLLAGSRIAEAYGALHTQERYRCRYGLRKELEADVFAGPLKVSGYDEDDEVRAMELQGHPFFVATLFQPERSALQGHTPPLVKAFVQACAQQGVASK
ncbi:Glutamine amidotransferase class-I [Pseudomonas sp. NFACC02]|uniref:CTP synthase C-terminal region-related (seleno)protein n=1 Tax=Pseudomonas sp. NFACC02 TaxID=1566250 RepID=UPI0008B4326D|nr:CTP synthase [Pseudomonas sp. NFACC02]SER28337.1 Glutamine amidotransferase class-I [Pseudomonas sp. NFACC02]